jgi:hypothetical protein
LLKGEPSLLELRKALVEARARGLQGKEFGAVDGKEGAVYGVSVGLGGDGGGRPAPFFEDDGPRLYGEVGRDRANVYPPYLGSQSFSTDWPSGGRSCRPRRRQRKPQRGRASYK